MARVEDNILTQGLRGKFGDMIFRKRGKKTMVYSFSPRKAPLSKKQVEAQLKFSEAVRLAREALRNETELKRFTKMAIAKNKENAYTAAISYFMSAK
jgi:hypothetical protein